MNKNNKSGHTGVYFDNTSQKWRAQISYSGEKIKIGYFSSLQDAVEARKNAKDFYAFKEFTGLKIPYFMFKCRDLEYNKCVPLLFDAAFKYVEDKNLSSFSSFAIRYISSKYNFVDDVEETDFKLSPMLKDWLDGISIAKLSHKYGVTVYSANLSIKKELMLLKSGKNREK